MGTRLPLTVRAARLSVAAATTLLLSVGCGGTPEPDEGTLRHSEAIIGGRPASAEELRSTVAITDPDGVGDCTGSLLAPRVVVTAAHCVVLRDSRTGLITPLIPEDFRVVAGAFSLAETSLSQTLRVKGILLHPGFPGPGNDDSDGLGQHDDIALLLLAEAAVTLTPIPIASESDLASLVPGTSLSIAGYGATDANGTGTDALYVAEAPYRHRNEREFIVGAEGEPDTCNGDSGGPAYLATSVGWRLLGAASRGVARAQKRCGAGGIFSWLPAYDAWITQHSNDASAPALAPISCQLSFSKGRNNEPRWLLMFALCALCIARRRSRATAHALRERA